MTRRISPALGRSDREAPSIEGMEAISWDKQPRVAVANAGTDRGELLSFVEEEQVRGVRPKKSLSLAGSTRSTQDWLPRLGR